jgi:hypothetical protein
VIQRRATAHSIFRLWCGDAFVGGREGLTLARPAVMSRRTDMTQGIPMALEDAKSQVDQAFMRDDLKGLSFENAFGGATSLFRRRYSKDLAGVDLVLTGVPFDQAVTHRPGTRFGPRAIREASASSPMTRPMAGTGSARWRSSPSSIMAIWPSIMPIRPAFRRWWRPISRRSLPPGRAP